jgi:hypothetical protein
MSFFDNASETLDAQKAANQEASEANRFEPEAGEEVQAVLLKADLYTKGQYDPAITITFRNVGDATVGGIEAGKSGRMFLSTVAERMFMEAAPAIGSPFVLRFEGKVTPEKGGNPYKNWTVVTPFTKDGDDEAYDRALWDAINPAGHRSSGGTRQSSGGDSGSEWKF